MQRWTDISACFSFSWHAFIILLNGRYGWCSAENLETLGYRDRLWDCLRERDESDNALDFRDASLHRVFKVFGKHCGDVIRIGRFGQRNHDPYAHFLVRLTT
jgi:hypothetical protein